MFDVTSGFLETFASLIVVVVVVVVVVLVVIVIELREEDYGYDEHDNDDNICNVEEKGEEEEQSARIRC